MQILPQNLSWGQSLGGALGEGLGAGLQALANAKIDQISRQRQALQTEQGLIGAGVDPKMAKQMRNLPPHLLQEAFKYQLKGPQEQALAQAYSSLLGGGQPQEQVQQQYIQAPAKTEAPGQYTELAKRLAPAVAASNMIGRPGIQPQAQAAVQKQATMQQQAGMPQAVTPEQVTQQATQMPSLPKRLNANDFRALTQMYMQKQNMDQKQAMNQAKLDLQKQHQEEMKSYHQGRLGIQQEGMEIKREQTGIKQEELSKAKKTDWKKVLDVAAEKGRAAKKASSTYKAILDVSKKGDYRSPMWTEVLGKFGIKTAGRNASTQLMQKLASELTADQAKGYGSQGSVFLDQILIEKNPNLLNDPNTNIALAKMGLANQEYDMAYEREMNKFHKEHAGEIIPENIESEINARLAPEAKKRDEVIRLASSDAMAFSSGAAKVGTPNYKDAKFPIGKQWLLSDGTVLTKSGTMEKPTVKTNVPRRVNLQ